MNGYISCLGVNAGKAIAQLLRGDLAVAENGTPSPYLQTTQTGREREKGGGQTMRLRERKKGGGRQ